MGRGFVGQGLIVETLVVVQTTSIGLVIGFRNVYQA